MGGIPDLDDEKEPAMQLKSSWCRRPEAAMGWSCTALIEQQDSVARISGHGESGSKGLGRGRSQGALLVSQEFRYNAKSLEVLGRNRISSASH